LIFFAIKKINYIKYIKAHNMTKLNVCNILLLGSFIVSSCGGGGSPDSATTTPTTPPPTPTPIATSALVSFSVADAPADGVISVNVTFDSITLKSSDNDGDDDSGINVPIIDSDGNPSAMTINLMDFQDGESKLFIENTEIDIGDYSSFIINTFGCPQNQNGSTEFCWVEDVGGIKTLKTPSNKLKLGAFSVSAETEQSYTIEFNLRSSLTSTANGASYNLKPHGVRIVNADTAGSVTGTVNVALLNPSGEESCEAVFQAETDHGKVVYLYKTALIGDNTLADEFDADNAENEIPENLIAPYASDAITFNAESDTYHYNFSHVEQGNYMVAFSCSAVGDDPVEYNNLVIPNPLLQLHAFEIISGEEIVKNFTE
jgi:hypothetical protein